MSVKRFTTWCQMLTSAMLAGLPFSTPVSWLTDAYEKCFDAGTTP